MTVDSTDWTSRTDNLSSTANASAGTWDPTLIDEIAFTNLANGRTFDIDHIDIATTEFQMLEYRSFTENTNNFQYFQGTLKAQYRAHGEGVSQLS